jgi:hypothetical protein
MDCEPPLPCSPSNRRGAAMRPFLSFRGGFQISESCRSRFGLAAPAKGWFADRRFGLRASRSSQQRLTTLVRPLPNRATWRSPQSSLLSTNSRLRKALSERGSACALRFVSRHVRRRRNIAFSHVVFWLSRLRRPREQSASPDRLHLASHPRTHPS